MARTENDFQSELVKDCTLAGLHAFKASHKYMTGVADLYIRSPDHAAWVECKFLKLNDRSRRSTVKLTGPQSWFLLSEKKAGGTVAVVIGYVMDQAGQNPVHGLFVRKPKGGALIVIERSNLSSDHLCHIVKQRGQPWNVGRLIEAIASVNDPATTIDG